MRREFTAKTKGLAFVRSGGHCEKCTAYLMTGRFHYDHVIPDALSGEPTLENCEVLCTACHGEKTRKADVPTIAKVKRIRAKHIGIKSGKGWNRKWKRKVSGETILR